MDEEKQKDDMMKKAGAPVQKSAKKAAKQIPKKIIKKIISAIAPYLIKAIAIAIIALLIVTAISDLIGKILGESAEEANAFGVHYTSNSSSGGNNGGGSGSGTGGNPGSSGTDTEGEETQNSLNRIIVNIDNHTEDGAYLLIYEFKDENGNLYSDTEALENIKRDLVEKNELLDVTKFNESELKIIGVLMYNGLMVDSYNEEELKAIALFVKADIASQSLDLRSGDNTDVNSEQLRKEDKVYGTIKINKTKIKKDSNEYSVVDNLKYVPYKEFSEMVEQNNTEAINSFSIDADGNLVFSKWNTTEEEYTYHPYKDIKKSLSEEEKQKISREIFKESKEKETNIVMSTPINFRQNITPYILNFGFLSDMLIVTDNAQFCSELAKLAFNSNIVVNIKEELQETVIKVQSDYVETKLLYDYVDYTVSGEREQTSLVWKELISRDGKPDDDSNNLYNSYGWSSSLKYTTKQVQDGNIDDKRIWEWTHNDVNYKLEYNFLSSGHKTNWVLYNQQESTENKEIEPLEGQQELINLNNNHINEEYDDYIIDEDFTDTETFKYTELETLTFEDNRYNVEISEVDTWYLKYQKGYEEPIKEEPKIQQSQTSEQGQYGKEFQLVLETEDKKEINKDKHVKDFIADKVNDYKKETGASNITSNVSKLTIKQKMKIDSDINYKTTITTYGFGEEDAENTGIRFKNIEYKNGPSFTLKDEDGNEETSFLSIYKKYRQAGVDLYLQNDSEAKLFNLLSTNVEGDNQTNSQTIGFVNIMKYLLYVADGLDRGITEYNLLQLMPKDFNSVSGLRGNTLADKIWYTLRGLGYSKASVAGVLGNLDFESDGLNTDIIEYQARDGIGLAQWSFDRRTALESYAWSKGVEWYDEDTQIEFLVDEINGQGKYTGGFATNAFLERKYNNKSYNKEIWENAEENNKVEENVDKDLAIEEATIAFCISWERPDDPQGSIPERIKRAIEYYEYYNNKEFGGTFSKSGCVTPVRAKFESASGRTFIIVKQGIKYNEKILFPKKCNRASCLSIVSGYAEPGTSVDELIDFINKEYDSKWHGAIPSNKKYWNHYGLEVTNAYAGEDTKDYMGALEEQLNSGGYALIWLNNDKSIYIGKSGTLWTEECHWIAILGIKYEDGECFIATSTSGGGVNDWVSIDEFTTHGVDHMVFVNPIGTKK